MRFIIILVLFTVIACASSHRIDPIQTATYELPKLEETKDQPNAIAYNLANDKAACTMSWCLNFCLSVMYPPFRYTCYGDYCICEKL